MIGSVLTVGELAFEIINPEEMSIGQLRECNKHLRVLYSQGEVCGSSLEKIDNLEKAAAIIALSIVDAFGKTFAESWDIANSVKVSYLAKLALSVDSDTASQAESSGGSVADFTGNVILSPTSAAS